MPFIVAATQSLGSLFNWLFQAIAWILAFFYSAIPSYGAAIILLTITVMILLAPLTLKSTRSMIAMQKLAPEMKKLQAKYKGDRAKLNEEMMRLYKEHNVSPLGGCLPMILQLPVFLVLYQVVRGLTYTNSHGVLEPKYINHGTSLYQHLIASHGHMMWLGMDLAKSSRNVGGDFMTKLPFYILILIAAGLQYLQMAQINNRNPAAAQANPQAMMIQRFMPLVMLVIYINIPAAVTLYFVVSSICRIVQQELMFRFDPVLARATTGPVAAKELEAEKPGAKEEEPRREGFLSRILNVGIRPQPQTQGLVGKKDRPAEEDSAQGDSAGAEKETRGGGSPRERGARAAPEDRPLPLGGGRSDNGRRSGQSGNGAKANGQAKNRSYSKGKPHSRSQAKKPRRPR